MYTPTKCGTNQTKTCGKTLTEKKDGIASSEHETSEINACCQVCRVNEMCVCLRETKRKKNIIKRRNICVIAIFAFFPKSIFKYGNQSV